MQQIRKIIENFKGRGIHGVMDIVWKLWIKIFRYVAALLALLALIYAFSIWYENLYKLDEDSETAKQEAEVRRAKVKFNEDKFEQAVFTIKQREIKFSEKGSQVKDIFFGGKQGDDVISSESAQESQADTSPQNTASSSEVENPFEQKSQE